MKSFKIPANDVRPGDICGFNSRVVEKRIDPGDQRMDVLLEKKNGVRFWTDWNRATKITVRREVSA